MRLWDLWRFENWKFDDKFMDEFSRCLFGEISPNFAHFYFTKLLRHDRKVQFYWYARAQSIQWNIIDFDGQNKLSWRDRKKFWWFSQKLGTLIKSVFGWTLSWGSDLTSWKLVNALIVSSPPETGICAIARFPRSSTTYCRGACTMKPHSAQEEE